MSISKYEAFLKTVEMGSLTRAAEALGYTQSGMTYILNSLEDECGLTLLKRDRSGVQLTSDGLEMLPYIEGLCESWRLISEKRDELKGMESGHLRIGTFTSVSTHWLPAIIHSFRESYPNITFELVHGDYAQIQDWLLRGRVDLGFTQLPLRDGLESLHLRSDALLAVLPEGHPLASRKSIDLDALLQEPFIMYAENTPGGIRVMLNSRRVKPNTQFVVEDDHAIIAMVEGGLGVSVLSDLVLRRSPCRIVKRPLEPPVCREIVLAYPEGRAITVSSRRFVEYVKNWKMSDQAD
ncbi:MAG: LysR family transcriptional regulator [Clostridia bacterium]|nr:LysR family transcriptional regulator [Clostridia bacterium]